MEGWQLVIVIAGVMTLFLVARWALLKWDRAEDQVDAMEEKLNLFSRTMEIYMELKGCEPPSLDLSTFRTAIALAFDDMAPKYFEICEELKIQPEELPGGARSKQGS